jgi:hypothetical protein
MIIAASAGLQCHPTTFSEEVRAVHVRVFRTSAGLELNFQLEGNISRISLLPQGNAQNVVQLWRHTCFEVFVQVEGHAAYHEFNFAPSREWQVYAFRGYRDRAPLANQFRAPIVTTITTSERLELDIRLLLNDLSPIHSRSTLRIGLCSVIELQDGSLSYWALKHLASKPDFHHSDAFALVLEAPQPNQ